MKFRYFQSDTSSKKDEKFESLSGAEDEQDLTTFNHIFDSDISPIQHFSTPITKSSTTQDTQPPPSSAVQQSQKRPTRAQQNNANSKRAKQIENSVSMNSKLMKVTPKPELEMMGHEDEETTDYIEAPPPPPPPSELKVDDGMMESEEPKQFLESNGNGNIVESNTQDQGRCFFCWFCFSQRNRLYKTKET